MEINKLKITLFSLLLLVAYSCSSGDKKEKVPTKLLMEVCIITPKL